MEFEYASMDKKIVEFLNIEDEKVVFRRVVVHVCVVAWSSLYRAKYETIMGSVRGKANK